MKLLTTIIFFLSAINLLIAAGSPSIQLKNDPNSPTGFLQKTIEHFTNNITDYTGTFIKQERIDGKLLEEQKIDFKFIQKPHSILMTWTKNAGKIDKLLYIQNENDNKALLHPTGLISWIKSVKRTPDDEEIMKSTLKPCTEFGFLKIAEAMLNEFKNYSIKSIETTNTENTNIAKLELSIETPQKDSPAKILVTYDTKLLAPIERKAYDAKDNLLYSYEYENLKFNTGLTEKDFTPKANGL